MRVVSLLALVLVACGTTSSTPDASVSDASTTDSSIGSSFASAGFTVQSGRYAFFDASQCCVLPTCFGNNPSSPYASVYLPNAPGQTSVNTNVGSDGMATAWRLRQDEAVVVLLTTPPTSKYFGYTPYVFDQAGDGGRKTVFASIGDTTNNLVIGASASPPFNAQTALVMTANQSTADTVKNVLSQLGYPSSEVNVLPVPTTNDLTIGLDDADDTFALLQRMALLDDPDAGAAYQANPPASVFRLTPTSPTAAAPYPAPTFRAPGTGTNEASLQASMTALHDAIVAKFSTNQIIPLNVGVKTPDQNDQYGTYCIDNDVDCAGDNRDAVYGVSDPFLLGSKDFVIVYGINHAATGKATYSNFAIYDLAKLMGISSVDDRKYGDSAKVFVPSDPNVGSLYAWTFARDCTGNAYCTAIATTCPGVPLLNLAFIATRAYLDPQTKTRPLSTELVLDDAIHFK